ncbi:MAG: hypothetical protein HPY51_19270 [Candidatus Omnitrophica bacterium]|nr:hypothetical protein [Candidatus Omnitrophota bacterium]
MNKINPLADAFAPCQAASSNSSADNGAGSLTACTMGQTGFWVCRRNALVISATHAGGRPHNL